MTKDHCDIYCFNEQKVNHVQQHLQEIDIVNTVQLFKALSDENKAKIVYALSLEKELCVCDIANIIKSTIPNTSFHLRALYKQDILQFRKEGKLAFYSLKDKTVKHLLMIAIS